MIAPDHETKPLETILRERGHPYMASGRDGSSDRRQAISGSGERSTTKARFSICWCNGDATRLQP